MKEVKHGKLKKSPVSEQKSLEMKPSLKAHGVIQSQCNKEGIIILSNQKYEALKVV